MLHRELSQTPRIQSLTNVSLPLTSKDLFFLNVIMVYWRQVGMGANLNGLYGKVGPQSRLQIPEDPRAYYGELECH